MKEFSIINYFVRNNILKNIQKNKRNEDICTSNYVNYYCYAIVILTFILSIMRLLLYNKIRIILVSILNIDFTIIVLAIACR